jgi:hypothetical protein
VTISILQRSGTVRAVTLSAYRLTYTPARSAPKDRARSCILRRPGLRLAAGALPLDQAILERDLMQLAKTPAKLKKSIFRTAVFQQSLRIYVTYGDLERRVLGDVFDPDRVGT